jgi:hypothetical protein
MKKSFDARAKGLADGSISAVHSSHEVDHQAAEDQSLRPLLDFAPTVLLQISALARMVAIATSCTMIPLCTGRGEVH